MVALMRLLRNCVEVLPAGSDRLVILDQAAVAALADVERAMPRAGDVERVRRSLISLRTAIESRREVSRPAPV
jgi:hypothetical protein